jgi:pyridoxal phosphate enzyme (YggS family)
MRSFAQEARSHGMKVIFGENYIQEARHKREELQRAGVEYDELHLQGPLQSNKVRDAVAIADVIQSVHSLKVLQLVAKEAARVGKRQRIFLQVNISDDPGKSGFSRDELEGVIKIAAQLLGSIALEGLMTITAFHENPEDGRADFRNMSELRRRLEARECNRLFEGEQIKLSMGMSADFTIAIEEGADLVRIGTALFGSRV